MVARELISMQLPVKSAVLADTGIELTEILEDM
jgi:hypothetical protein